MTSKTKYSLNLNTQSTRRGYFWKIKFTAENSLAREMLLKKNYKIVHPKENVTHWARTWFPYLILSIRKCSPCKFPFFNFFGGFFVILFLICFPGKIKVLVLNLHFLIEKYQCPLFDILCPLNLTLYFSVFC